jgi:hypothetical protein
MARVREIPHRSCILLNGNNRYRFDQSDRMEPTLMARVRMLIAVIIWGARILLWSPAAYRHSNLPAARVFQTRIEVVRNDRHCESARCSPHYANGQAPRVMTKVLERSPELPMTTRLTGRSMHNVGGNSDWNWPRGPAWENQVSPP